MAQEYPKFKFLPSFRGQGEYSYVPPGAPPEEPPNPWMDIRYFPLIPTARDIAKSGIFTVDEKLKGSIPKETGFRTPKRVYEIDDLPGFVLKLAQAVEIFPKLGKKEEWQKIIENQADSLLKEFDQVIEILQRCDMESFASRWEKLRWDAEGLKEKTLPKMKSPIIRDIVDRCIIAFKNHLPEVIDEVIAERIAELLKHFRVTKKDKDIKPASILKMLQRKFK